MPMNNPFTRVLMLASFAAYVFIYIPGVVLLALDIKIGDSTWVSGLLLILAGISAALWVVINRGIWRGLVFTVSVLLLSYFIEYLGVSSGLIFGSYQYTDVLVPRIGAVPLAIPFAWLTVVLGSWYVANTMASYLAFSRKGRGEREATPHAISADRRGDKNAHRSLSTIHPSSVTMVLLAGALTLLLDLLIEPVAVYVSGFWTWSGGGLYYGVPGQNFVAWWLVGVVMAVVAVRTVGSVQGAAFALLPPLLYLSNALLFGVVALAHGYFATALLAVLALFVGGFAGRTAIQTKELGHLALGCGRLPPCPTAHVC